MKGEILSIDTANKIADLEKENERLKEIINDDMTAYLKGFEDGKQKTFEELQNRFKDLKKKMYEAAEILKLRGNFGEEFAQVIYSRNTVIDLLKLLKVGDNND